MRRRAQKLRSSVQHAQQTAASELQQEEGALKSREYPVADALSIERKDGGMFPTCLHLGNGKKYGFKATYWSRQPWPGSSDCTHPFKNKSDGQMKIQLLKA